jgi:hypothetical protein
MGLFKYTNHFGVNIIKDLQLKVTPPNEFNDPFEFSPYLIGEIDEAHARQLLDNYSPKELYETMKIHGVQEMPFEEFLKSLKTIIPAAVKQGIPAFQKAYEEIVSKFSDSMSKEFGLVCFSEEENNMLLWSHYTDGHKGMLIEFETSHTYFTRHSKFKKVRYESKRVPLDPTWPDGSPEIDNYSEQLLCIKNSIWSYENEWRSLFPLNWCHPKKYGQRTLYFTDIPPEMVKRVVLGYRCEPEVEKQVIEAKTQRGLNFSLFRAVLHPTEFKVEYKPL